MRRLGRGFLWVAAFAMTGGLAWWGWSLGPAPRFVLSASRGGTCKGFSADSRWLAVEYGERLRLLDALTGREVVNQAGLSLSNPVPGRFRDPVHWHVLLRGEKDSSRLVRLDGEGRLITVATAPAGYIFYDEFDEGRTLLLRSPRDKKGILIRDGVSRDIEFMLDANTASCTANANVFIVSGDLTNRPWLMWDAAASNPDDKLRDLSAFAVSNDRRFLATCEATVNRGQVRVRDLTNGIDTVIDLPVVPPPAGLRLTFSPDNRTLVVEPYDAADKVFTVTLDDPTKHVSLPMPSALAERLGVFNARLLNDGAVLFANAGGWQLGCWDKVEGAFRLRGVIGPSGTFAGDGREVAVLSERLPESTPGRVVSPLTPGWLSRRKCSFGGQEWDCQGSGIQPTVGLYDVSADGHFVMMEASYHYIQSQLADWLTPPAWGSPRTSHEAVLIDVKTMRPIAAWPSVAMSLLQEQIRSSHFSPDAQSLAINHDDGRISVYDLPPARRALLPSLMTLPLLALPWLFWRRRKQRTTVVER